MLQNQQQEEQAKKSKYIYPHPLFFKYKFLWENLRFIVINYYLFQAVLSSTFYSIYQISSRSFFPLNIILLLFLGLDFGYKFCMTEIQKLPNKIRFYKLFFIYFCKSFMGIELIVLIVFYVSFMLPFEIGRWFRLVFMFKFVDCIQYNEEVYRRLELYPVAKKTYTIVKICYLMMMFSHYFGCWFQLMDQATMNAETYGPIDTKNLLYYQMNLTCFTPIETMGDWGRYLYGLYFLVSLITTIAFGDIIGKNPIQQIYVTFLMIISTITIALILQQFMNLVREDSLGTYQFVKIYNCLKTKMNDNNISIKTQNRIRSYLVFLEYEKKFHTHEPVVQKLSYQYQKALSSELYLKYFVDNLVTNIGLLTNQDLTLLVNKSKVLTFQAQTEIYQEIQNTQENPRCQLLYKIQGPVQERIMCPFNQYAQKSKQISYKKTKAKHIKLETQDKRIFNMANFFLNFQSIDKSIEFEEEDLELLKTEQEGDISEEYLNLISPPVETSRTPFYLQPQNRTLRSIKISSFLLVTQESFMEYLKSLHDCDKISKNILGIRERILCKEYPLTALGEYCTVCLKEKEKQDEFSLYKKYGIINSIQKMNACQHLNEQCPLTHYVISQNELQYARPENRKMYPIKRVTQTIKSKNQERMKNFKREGDKKSINWLNERKSRRNTHLQPRNSYLNPRNSNLNSRYSSYGSGSRTDSRLYFNQIPRRATKLQVLGGRHQMKSQKMKGIRHIPHLTIQNLVADQSDTELNVLDVFKNTVLKIQNRQQAQIDSTYDPQGIDLRFSIPYFGNDDF